MSATIGIRLEDKNKWERRVPLTPSAAASIQKETGCRVLVQPSSIRVFGDEEYARAGVDVSDAAVEADVLIAVKEIPSRLYRPGGVYVCFSHTIKGQDYNMPSLRTLMDRGATLVDYERIVDAHGRRLIFFSTHAGYAGMIESLRALGLRLASRGRPTPLADIKPTYAYADLGEAERHITAIGKSLETDGRGPLVIGVSGYGNVSQGAQKILSWLPVREIKVEDLPRAAEVAGDAPLALVVFKEEDMVRPAGDHAFELQDYYDHPERYEGCFERHLPHLDLLVNTIYWTAAYPRLVTREWAASQFAGGAESRLQVIGDISIDIEGSIEMSVKSTYPDAPCFVFDPVTGGIEDGLQGRGIAIMAVDNLPCELPREASEYFSSVLREMVVDLGRADWRADFEDLDLPPHLKTAVIVHKGELTPAYTYLETYLKDVDGEA